MELSVFRTGSKYSRKQIQELVGVRVTRGGNWYTGYHRHEDCVFVFVTLGVPARTGHEYGDRWLPDGTLEWFGKTKSGMNQPQIQFMTRNGSNVLLFTRENDRESFEFQGRVRAVRVDDQTPVRVIWKIE